MLNSSSLPPETGGAAPARYWEAGERTNLRQALRLLNRRKWFLAGPVVALTALKLLTEVTSNVGVVLSQVDLRRHAKYGFSDYAASYSKYRNYYVS